MKLVKIDLYFLVFALLMLPILLKAQSANDSTEVGKVHMFTYKRIFSKNYEGWSIQYREFNGITDEFVVPITLSFGSFQVKNSLLEKKNIVSLDTYSLGIGFDGYQKLINSTYLNIGLGTILGVESSENTVQEKDNRFLIGGTSQLGILFIPFQEFGLVIGANVIGRLSNSKIINRDLGINIEVGINF